MFAPEIDEVHWELTNHCNLKCVHCYLAPDPRRELTTAEIKDVIDQLLEVGALTLTLSGGEPLLRRDFAEIYQYAHGKGFVLQIFTNGTRISPAVVELFKTHPPFKVEITLNGITAETFEKVTAVKGSFETCMSGIRAIHEAGIRLVLKTNGMTLNIHEVLKIKEFALGLNPQGFKFDTALMPKRDHDMFPTTLRLQPSEIIALYEEDRAMKTQIQQECAGSTRATPPPGSAFSCTAARTRFHISAWGDLHPCHTVRPIKVSLLEHRLPHAMQLVRDLVNGVKYPATSKCGTCDIFFQCNSCVGLAHLEGRDGGVMPTAYHCDVAHKTMETYGNR
ncbi:MAG: radical SAM protein [Deltaproteobacteria bacterium]|nr:radical SAM protein [Deltaproteobacteria bacterium]